MRAIPLNLMTLYADLMQSVGTLAAVPGSVATKTVHGRSYLYATSKDGAVRIEKYLGPADDPTSREQATLIRQAAAQAKAMRNTVTLLRRARIAAPTLPQGRVLEVLANAGLFERGMTLVGTVAYQTYACVVGAHLGAASYATNDVDLSVAELVSDGHQEDIAEVLRRADTSFRAVWHANDRLPRVFRSDTLQVDMLTKFGRGRASPVSIPGLGCAAVALAFQEYPAEDTMEVVALYGSGVLVRVPSPVRFATHKLLVAQRRDAQSWAKRQKDLRQADELIAVYLETDEHLLLDTLDEARGRGRAWREAINASLRELGRESRQGQLPLQVERAAARARPARRPRLR
jgi:hypothetical protein